MASVKQKFTTSVALAYSLVLTICLWLDVLLEAILKQ